MGLLAVCHIDRCKLLLASLLTLASLSGCFQASQETGSVSRSNLPSDQQSSTRVQSTSVAPLYHPELCSQGETADVISVIDGDTIDVRFPSGAEERIRYIGIDTPETGEACFSEATQRNRELVENREVRLVRDTSDRDIYGRLVRYVCLHSGQFIEAQLVAEGYAYAYRYYPDTQYADYLQTLETEALDARRGCLHEGYAVDDDAGGTSCCKVCRSSQPCGDSCISWSQSCEAEPGCACAG